MVAVYVNEPFGKEKARDYREEVDQELVYVYVQYVCASVCVAVFSEAGRREGKRNMKYLGNAIGFVFDDAI